MLTRTICLLIGLMLSNLAHAQSATVRIGLTPVFLDDQLQVIRQWRGYLETRLGQPVQFVQRQTYREVTDLLLQGELDAAWLCGYPFVRHQKRLTLLAVPLYQGRPLYQSYLITSSADTGATSVEDLRGRIMAFSDPDSNSGYLYPVSQIRAGGARVQDFFQRTFFTWGHRGVIQAVADGLATAGAVDGYVWETLKQQSPELVTRTRVVVRSQLFGFPPFVQLQTRRAENAALARVLLDMSADPTGRDILSRLNLDGFIEGDPSIYSDIERMSRAQHIGAYGGLE